MNEKSFFYNDNMEEVKKEEATIQLIVQLNDKNEVESEQWILTEK